MEPHGAEWPDSATSLAIYVRHCAISQETRSTASARSNLMALYHTIVLMFGDREQNE
jgi:hypothetical protein